MVSENISSCEKGLWTEEEAAAYLDITVEEFQSIIEKQIEEKQNVTSYSTYRYIPYIELENGEKKYNKIQLDSWIEFNMLNY